MQELRMGVIGMGNMGSHYAELIAEGKIPGLVLSAVTRVRPERLAALQAVLPEKLPIYPSADALFEAVESGKLELDGVVIATPHYSHQEQAVRAFRNGLHVLCDKPAGAYSRQGREMEEARQEADTVFAMVFNQRTNPIYRRMKEIVESGSYGKLKRVHWVVTDWYRPDCYYTECAWRGTWDKDGGGTLLNQCPHNLDLLQWICGMPIRTQAFCHEGKYHPIEVEDEVTAYMEWEDGVTGVFLASTGEAPGVNRLEIALEDALLVCENGELKVCELGIREPEYRHTATESFKKLTGQWKVVECGEKPAPYEAILYNFYQAVCGQETPIASGIEGRNSLLLSNAIYLSSWEKRMVEIPIPGTSYEQEFERAFEKGLAEKRK